MSVMGIYGRRLEERVKGGLKKMVVRPTDARIFIETDQDGQD